MLAGVFHLQFAWYLRNCANSSASIELAEILSDTINQFSDKYFSDLKIRNYSTESEDNSFSLPPIKLFEIQKLLKEFWYAPRSGDNLEINVEYATEEFGLDAIDREILLLVLRYDRNPDFENFADRVARKLTSVSRAVATLIGANPREVHRRLINGGLLVDTGILSMTTEGNGLAGRGGFLRLASALACTMHRPYQNSQKWIEAIIGRPLATSLEWNDYAHLERDRDLSAAVLKASSNGKETGINILLHGPVGTGKTEFAKVLAQQTGFDVWAIGEISQDDAEPTRGERIGALRLAERLLSRRKNALLVVDECEDILSEGSASYRRGPDRHSKIFMCRMLEQNQVPIIWICNELYGINFAVLRRMTLAINIKVPGPRVRERIWRRSLAEQRITLDPGAISRLANRYDVAPALIVGACRAARLSSGNEAAIETAMNGVMSIIGRKKCSDPIDHAKCDKAEFNLGLVNCRDDLIAISRQLGRPGTAHRWSMCIQGAPGTGKSMFARHLAKQISLKPIQVRASDILSKWLGDTEQRIAAAFAEAREEGAVLILDEADSLLHNRQHAQRSWEVTQVNEMLTCMENHPLPFICTTNFAEWLDPATLRRFTFKLAFKPLHEDQARQAFIHFFGVEPSSQLPDDLTPGDFATVQRKAGIFGETSPETLIRWLHDEVEARGCRRHPVGFAPA